ncbi:hypothetical protein Tco_0290587 [Tanacetum coccineum]
MTVNRLVLEWEERIRLHHEKEIEFERWRSKNFKNEHPSLTKLEGEMEDEGEVTGGGLILYQAYGNLYDMTGRKAHLLEDKKILSVGVFDEVFSTWMAFGGNTRDLGSFGEETDEITDLHQIYEEILFSKRGDGVAGTK